MRMLDGGSSMFDMEQDGKRHYGSVAAIAIAVVIVAAFVRFAFLQSLEFQAPFITFFPAVVIAALYGGLWAGAIVTFLSAIITDYFLIEPVGSLLIARFSDGLALGIFVADGLLVSWVADRLQRANSRLRQAEIFRSSELERQIVERTKHEEEFSLLAEALPQLVWITRADGWNVYFNQKWVAYTGLTLEESYGHGWNKPFHPDDQQRAWDAWQAAVNHHAPYSLECRLRRADGSYRWWLVRGVPQVNANGTIESWFGTCTDIHDLTWRKQAEEGGQASERIYRAIGESNDYGIWICAPDGRNIYASPSFLNLVGLTQQECSDFGWSDVLHPDERERTVTAWQECVRVQGKWDTEHRFRGVDGQWHYLLARGIPVRNDVGEITCWAGINLDISNIKNAEAALVRANRILHARSLTNIALVKATDELSYLQTACQIVVDVCGHSMMWIGYADQGAERRVIPIAAFGVDEGYLEWANITWGSGERGRGPTGTAIRTGQPNVCEDTSEDERLAPWRSEAMMRGFRSSIALPLVAGGDTLGALTIYASVANAFPECEVKVLADIAHDIAFGVSFLRLRADNSRVEQSLRETQKNLALFIEHAPAALAMLDNNMRYLFASQRWLMDSRLDLSDVIGKSHYDVFPEIPQRWKDIHRRCLSGAIEKCNEDGFVRGDGRTDWIRWEIRPWWTEDNIVGGIVIMSEDITDQVQARTIIESARQAAEAANEAKTRFLASVSHDLRQPLQAQRFILFNLTRKVAGADQIKACAQIELTLDATEMMLSRLMDYAALESGNVEVTRDIFQLDRLVLQIIEEVNDEATKKGIKIRYHTRPCLTESDPVLLARIVRNLIANALRYTDRGGIFVGIRHRGDRCRLEVWDTGKGIPANQQQAIFEEFRQLDNPERNRTKGYGLGLAIVAKTAELLDHRLFLRSVVGRGSVFAIELPHTDRLNRATDVEIAEAVPIGGPNTILLVEDDQMQAEALAAVFSDIGYHVIVAHDAGDAMAFRSPHLDLIVSDYRLPGRRSGVDIVASLRQAYARSIPAIIMTGDTQASIALEVARAGCDIVHKPCHPNVLINTLTRLLPPPPPPF